MSNENQTEPGKPFAQRLLPWVLGAVMLLVYVLTLNHGVTLANLQPVAKVSGFLWQPQLFGPLMFLLTSPFRLLPVTAVPLALNLFSALCAALTLVLLARSVAILPHDRTEAQRLREPSARAFLTVAAPWFPPLLAVLMFGLQFGFWEHATSFTGESLNLLVFATLIWLLLEYRLDERVSRLYLAALLYGAGMTENWALIGFLPVFVVVILWLRGLEFFKSRFLSRMVLCGAAGLSLHLVLPLVAKLSGQTSASFWELLKPALRLDWQVVHAISRSDLRHNLLLMSVTTFLPLLVMAIRWSASFGDSSAAGKLLATQMFHLIHAVFFGVCVWIMFDPPFSPGHLAMDSPALTFYYLSALAIGYYCGYFLLVFGEKARASRWNPWPDPALPKLLDWLTPVIYWATYAAGVLVAVTLAYKNLPLIRASNDDTLRRYAELTIQSLPKAGGVLLSDSEGLTSSPETRALLLQAELARTGRAKDFLVVDTQLLNWAEYHQYLHKKAPKKWPQLPGEPAAGLLKPVAVMSLLNEVAKSNHLCYLNPSFGYYFELFYQEPHGLVYTMKALPADTLLPPPLSNNLIAENQSFWSQALKQEIPRVEQALLPYKPSARLNPANWLIMHLHGQADPNPNAVFVANLYSRALDFWGVKLQQAGQLPAAAICFAQAKKLNPDNVVADINLEFNRTLQARAPVEIDPNRVNADQFGKYRDWNAVMNAGGPFDEPSFLFVNSVILARNGLIRQTVAPFERLRQLTPDNLPTRLWLAQGYLYNRLPDRALEVLREPMTPSNAKRFGLDETNVASLNQLAAFAHFQKNEVARGTELLEAELNRNPQDTNLLTTATQVFFSHELYPNALKVIQLGLARTPDNPQWLFAQGFACLQLSNYTQAVTALTRVLDLVTNDPNARFNRALAFLKLDRLDQARADYAALQTTYTNSFQVAYGLAEVAWRQHNTNEALHNYTLYLLNGPTNTAEFQSVRERVAQLLHK